MTTETRVSFYLQMGAIRKSCPEIDFGANPHMPTYIPLTNWWPSRIVFVDGVFALEPDESQGAWADQTLSAEAGRDPALTPRAWFKCNAEKSRTVGVEYSLLRLRSILKDSHFDVSRGIAPRGLSINAPYYSGCLRFQVSVLSSSFSDLDAYRHVARERQWQFS